MGRGAKPSQTWQTSAASIFSIISKLGIFGTGVKKLAGYDAATAASVLNGLYLLSQRNSSGSEGSSGSGGGEGAKTGLEPERKYKKGGKHGVKWTEGRALAKDTGLPQGQWGSLADLEFAGNKAATLKAGEGSYFELPSGHRSIVHMPDGSIQKATHIWVKNNGTGTFHGYPLIK